MNSGFIYSEVNVHHTLNLQKCSLDSCDVSSPKCWYPVLSAPVPSHTLCVLQSCVPLCSWSLTQRSCAGESSIALLSSSPDDPDQKQVCGKLGVTSSWQGHTHQACRWLSFILQPHTHTRTHISMEHKSTVQQTYIQYTNNNKGPHCSRTPSPRNRVRDIYTLSQILVCE